MPLLAKDCSESQKTLSKIVAKTWLDEDFNSRFFSNTTAVLEENGLTLPNDVEFNVNENTLVGTLKSTDASTESELVYEIPLPAKPGTLTDQHLQSWNEREGDDSLAIAACSDG